MHLSEKVFGCKIIIFKTSYRSSHIESVKKFNGFTFNRYMRWEWFFRYYAAKLQVENPKKLVTLDSFSYENKSRNIIPVYKAKLTKYRNELLRIEEIISKNRDLYYDLFTPFESTSTYRNLVQQKVNLENKIMETRLRIEDVI